MSLPQGAILIGEYTTPLEINGAGATATVPLPPEGQRKLLDSQAVYLMLENVRGNRDASVLNVYLGSSGNPETAHYFLVGSEGLYGLRRASKGTGLTFLFNITQVLRLASLAEKIVSDRALYVCIVPDRPLPDSPDVAIERVCIFGISLG